MHYGYSDATTGATSVGILSNTDPALAAYTHPQWQQLVLIVAAPDMNAAQRPTAPRQAKPAQRYFPGKVPRGAAAVSDSEESDEDVNEAQLGERDVPLGGDQAISGDEEDEEGGRESAAAATAVDVPAKRMNISLRNANITDSKAIADDRTEPGRTETECEPYRNDPWTIWPDQLPQRLPLKRKMKMKMKAPRRHDL